jgi:hypothetical protein
MQGHLYHKTPGAMAPGVLCNVGQAPSSSYQGRARPKISPKINRMRNIQNIITAKSVAAPASPPKPRTAAIRATTSSNKTQRMFTSQSLRTPSVCHYTSRPPRLAIHHGRQQVTLIVIDLAHRKILGSGTCLCPRPDTSPSRSFDVWNRTILLQTQPQPTYLRERRMTYRPSPGRRHTQALRKSTVTAGMLQRFMQSVLHPSMITMQTRSYVHNLPPYPLFSATRIENPPKPS